MFVYLYLYAPLFRTFKIRTYQLYALSVRTWQSYNHQKAAYIYHILNLTKL